MRHIHADVIHAWAEGEEIELEDGNQNWKAVQRTPCWGKDVRYRVKPKDVIEDYWCRAGKPFVRVKNEQPANLRLTFDANTGQLKNAEVLYAFHPDSRSA